MRDFMPGEKEVRDRIGAEIRDAYNSFGYREIETPAMEELDRLESGLGGDNEKLMFRVLRRGLDPDDTIEVSRAADLGLRFDLTVPLARFFATNRARLPDVFRSIQIGPAWRAERPQRGRYRQFTQCDIDVLGEASILAEVELLTATAETMERLGIEGLSFRLNDRRILLGMLDACGFPEPSFATVLVTVDKLDRIGVSGVAAELRGRDHLPKAVGTLIDFLETLAPASPVGASDFAKVLAAVPGESDAAKSDLQSISAAYAASDGRVDLVVDPTLVRGMGYYTGPIFETFHPDFPGSVASGGRYDGMIGRFAGVDVPASGISIGFDRLIELVDRSKWAADRRRVAIVYESGADPGELVTVQRSIVRSGADVRLVERIRNIGRLLRGLEDEGFESYVLVGLNPASDDPVLRPLGRPATAGS